MSEDLDPTGSIQVPVEEECTTCGPPPSLKRSAKKEKSVTDATPLLSGVGDGDEKADLEEGEITEGDDDPEKKGFWASVGTLLISIPSIIGACCWPALVMALMSVSATAAARKLGHLIALIVTAIMMIVVDSFIAYQSKKRFGKHWHTYGPLYLCLIATPLILADPTRHVLQDTNVWPSDKGSAQYRSDCGSETLKCLSAVGIIFTCCTWIGFGFLMFGTMWNAKIIEQCKKIRAAWRELRGKEPEPSEPSEPSE